MNFLVTGGAGFIGSHVCERLLRDGHRVWAFDDLNDFYDPQIKRRTLRELQATGQLAGGWQAVREEMQRWHRAQDQRDNSGSTLCQR